MRRRRSRTAQRCAARRSEPLRRSRAAGSGAAPRDDREPARGPRHTARMKRDPRLRDLSDDHHSALVLAARARRAAAAGAEDARALRRLLRARFDAELEPHFAIEDALLLPAMDAAGLGTLADRIRRDHRALRELVGRTPAGDAETRSWLAELGAQLEAHVRFEERQAFEAAQAALPDAALGAIAAATRARGSGGARPAGAVPPDDDRPASPDERD